jgi:hypothetical protein
MAETPSIPSGAPNAPKTTAFAPVLTAAALRRIPSAPLRPSPLREMSHSAPASVIERMTQSDGAGEPITASDAGLLSVYIYFLALFSFACSPLAILATQDVLGHMFKSMFKDLLGGHLLGHFPGHRFGHLHNHLFVHSCSPISSVIHLAFCMATYTYRYIYMVICLVISLAISFLIYLAIHARLFAWPFACHSFGYLLGALSPFTHLLSSTLT